MLDFIDYCNLDDALSGVEGMSKKHINTVLLSVRNYYQFLKRENETIINPATNLYIKGIVKKMPTSIINYQELENLYQSLETKDNRGKRNKVILGLLVYQGLTTEELHQLEPNNLKLKEGKITIRGSRKRNSRILELKPFQILELQEYVNEIRTTINHENSSQLFLSMEGNTNLKNSLHHLFRAIKRMNPIIGSGKQIRQSTITHWLKSHNLREVQYMAGHKYVSSTERYQVNNLEELKKNLEKYHPLK
jgi:integrase/recombinase XerD